MEKEKITESCGNIFLDIGFPPDEAAILTMRPKLMCELRIKTHGKWGKFSLTPSFPHSIYWQR